MKAFYGSRISEHMTRTPEGYLVCHGVPIARTGMQEYAAQELGQPGRYGEMIEVRREEAEVFAPATLASFEGKPVTDGHPPENVVAGNAMAYTKGHAQNVRRGAGEDADKLLADLVIIDAMLISEIEGGKREISCGYNANYEERNGEIYQTSIRGNHVAVVPCGRAGETVAIRDQKPEENEKNMP